MSTWLFSYQDDGAHEQARAVLGCLPVELRRHDFPTSEQYGGAHINIGRWENCREQGYVVYMRSSGGDQLNIAFFEHRNSDSICAVKWKQRTINSPTIDTAEFGDVYTDKFDVSHRVGFGACQQMASWIAEQFYEFWVENNEK